MGELNAGLANYLAKKRSMGGSKPVIAAAAAARLTANPDKVVNNMLQPTGAKPGPLKMNSAKDNGHSKGKKSTVSPPWKSPPMDGGK